MNFEPKRHLIKVQGGREYLPVSARLIWFRNEHPDWGIETEPFVIDIERQDAIFRAKVFDADGKLMAVGTKREDIRGFPDYIEKAETGAVGRALALCGFGTQFAPELDEVSAERFADSPQPARQPSGAIPVPAGANLGGLQLVVQCDDCKRGVTKSQQTQSQQHFKANLCPACQKARREAPAATAGASQEVA